MPATYGHPLLHLVSLDHQRKNFTLQHLELSIYRCDGPRFACNGSGDGVGEDTKLFGCVWTPVELYENHGAERGDTPV